MWIARGHQRPHANVVPSSFVVPNVPFLMCQDTSASQLPVVGSASKLHGHPQAQLQLWIYSASKFHFVGIGRTPSPRFGNVWRILNRSPEVPNSRVRTFISTPAFTTADGGGGSRRADGAPAAHHDSRCGRGCSRRRCRVVRDVDIRRFPHGAGGAVDHYVDGPRPVFRTSPGHDGRDDAAVGHADDPRVPRPHAARGGADREACGRARNLCFRWRILPRMGCVRGRRVVCIDGAGDPRTVDGGRGAYPRRNARRRRCVASDPDEGGMPETLHLPHGVRHAPLAIRSGRRMEDGASAFAVLRRVLLALHDRLVRRGLDEPRMDGRSVDCDSRGEARGENGVLVADDRARPPRAWSPRGPRSRPRAVNRIGTRIAHPFQSSAGGGIVLSSRTGEKKTQGTASSPPTTAMTSAGYTPMTSPRPPPTRFPMGRVPQTRKRIVALSRP